jgi:hypothetical protein
MRNATVVRVGGCFWLAVRSHSWEFSPSIAAANNCLLPLWMIIFGVSLLRYRPGVAEIKDQAA